MDDQFRDDFAIFAWETEPLVSAFRQTFRLRIAERWTGTWDGRSQYGVGDGCFHHPGTTDRVLVFSVTPTKVLAFAKGDFSHTSHRFGRAEGGSAA